MNQIRILAVSATFLFFNVIVAQDETEMIHIVIRCICEGHLRELTGRAKATRLNGRTRYDPVGLTYIQMYECTRGGRIIWRRRGRRKGRRRNRNRNRNTNQ
ncbi:hypothetical protein KUTeg_012601 [Tegillarca granosa]|uniref:Secreted protein n=1 Tax=Tegillarca granosa TaxID=220873 RepID=A0ABQ9F3I0_TEGGR|nr:hypothetical protein KUTeg_012601 [Tegillarca granosa]